MYNTRLLNELRDVSIKLNDIQFKLRIENSVCRAELIDRLRLNLSGDAAIKHYNDWMDDNGLDYLKV